MAEENLESGTEGEAQASASPKPSKLPLLLVLLNTLAILGALGLMFYTQMVYKRPTITESAERKKLEDTEKEILVGEPGQIAFEKMTVNIKPAEATPGNPKKLHYASFAFHMEFRDLSDQQNFETVRTKFMDQLIEHIGRKTFKELTSVQGRYLLRAELVDVGNALIGKPVIQQLYFSEFLVQ